jgi:hypothetical protein
MTAGAAGSGIDGGDTHESHRELVVRRRGISTLQHAIAVVSAAAERFGGEVEEGRLFLAPCLAAA